MDTNKTQTDFDKGVEEWRLAFQKQKEQRNEDIELGTLIISLIVLVGALIMFFLKFALLCA